MENSVWWKVQLCRYFAADRKVSTITIDLYAGHVSIAERVAQRAEHEMPGWTATRVERVGVLTPNVNSTEDQ